MIRYSNSFSDAGGPSFPNRMRRRGRRSAGMIILASVPPNFFFGSARSAISSASSRRAATKSTHPLIVFLPRSDARDAATNPSLLQQLTKIRLRLRMPPLFPPLAEQLALFADIAAMLLQQMLDALFAGID